MAATTQITTFQDAYLSLQYKLRYATGTTGTGSTTQQAQQAINQALHDILFCHDYKFPWMERRGILLTHATYTTGTVTITDSARTTVTGASTLWNTAVTGMGFNNARAGGKMKFDQTHVHEVSSVGSDTSITLVDRYVGTLGTGLAAGSSYTYYEDEYELASDFKRLVDATSFDIKGEIRVLPRSEFYRKHPVNNQPSAQPKYCTIFEKAPSASTARRQRVIFAAPPNSVSRIAYRYITSNVAVSSSGTEAANLSGDTDEPLFPLGYRHAIVLYALHSWYRDKGDDTRSGEAWQEYTDTMLRVLADVGIGERRPQLQPNMRPYADGAKNPWRYAGRRRVYDTGGAFDQGL